MSPLVIKEDIFFLVPHGDCTKIQKMNSLTAQGVAPCMSVFFCYSSGRVVSCVIKEFQWRYLMKKSIMLLASVAATLCSAAPIFAQSPSPCSAGYVFMLQSPSKFSVYVSGVNQPITATNFSNPSVQLPGSQFTVYYCSKGQNCSNGQGTPQAQGTYAVRFGSQPPYLHIKAHLIGASTGHVVPVQYVSPVPNQLLPGACMVRVSGWATP